MNDVAERAATEEETATQTPKVGRRIGARESLAIANMPSHGSNDGYGRQQLGARPSTRQTEIGRRQMQSSIMASILAEEDIVRQEVEERAR